MPAKMARSDPQTPFGRLEWRQPARTWQLGFQPVQKMPIIHVSSGFIRGIPVYMVLNRNVSCVQLGSRDDNGGLVGCDLDKEPEPEAIARVASST